MSHLAGTETSNFKIAIPDTGKTPWHLYYQELAKVVDALIGRFVVLSQFTGLWTRSTRYELNDKIVSDETGLVYYCATAHTSPATGDFTDELTNNPARWSVWSMLSGVGALASRDTINTTHIENGAVTFAKMADVASGTILGRDDAGSGSVEALTAAETRTLLGLTALATATDPLPVANGGTAATTAADARTNLGLGTIATQNANAVSISGGSVTGITDITVADGGTGASTAALARVNLGTRPTISAADYGFATSASGTANRTALAAAISAASAINADIGLPAGNFALDVSAGALVIGVSGVTIKGAPGLYATTITLAAGTNDVFQFTGSSAAIVGCGVESIRFDGSAMTGGTVIKATWVGRFVCRDIKMSSPWNGFYITKANFTTLDNCWLNDVNGDYGLQWVGDASNRSDVLNLVNVQISGDPTNLPDGIIWDGNCHTLRAHGVGVVSVNKGLWVKNTAGATAPSFLYAHNLEIDFPEAECIDIDVGTDFYVHGIYAHGSNTEHGIAIASGVQRVVFSGGKVTGHEKAGFSIAGERVDIFGAKTENNSQAGANSYSGIEIEAAAIDVSVIGGRTSGTNQEYGIEVKAAATRVAIVGVDLDGNATGTFLDASAVGFGNVKATGNLGATDAYNRTDSISFYNNAAASLTWTNQPAAATFLNGASRTVIRKDLSAFTQARLVVMKAGTNATAGAKLHLRYNASNNFTVGNYLQIGASAAASVNIDTADTMLTSAWVDLAAGAKADVYLAVVGEGGDGATSPVFGSIVAEFR